MLHLTPTAGDATFSRIEPYADGREVIVRRGRETGHRYGFAQSRRTLRVAGAPLIIVCYEQVLSPPPLMPGAAIMSPEDAAHYRPQNEVAYAPDLEIMVRRVPKGFTSAETDAIVAALYRQTQIPLTPTQETRFVAVQSKCAQGRVPDLTAGDVIYVPTVVHLTPGERDVIGGLALVNGVRSDMSAGRTQPFVSFTQDPAMWHAWPVLASAQPALAAEHGRCWSFVRADVSRIEN